MTPPEFPAGPYAPEDCDGSNRRAEWTAEIEAAPAQLRKAVAGLAPGDFDVRFRNWTVRQIVAHLADSHLNAFVRFKLALTEDVPAIKPYDENRWVQLADSAHGDIGTILTLFDALHARWVQLLRSMSDADFARCYFHPEGGTKVSLSAALSQYAWHGRHHTGQIVWLREHHGWGGHEVKHG